MPSMIDFNRPPWTGTGQALPQVALFTLLALLLSLLAHNITWKNIFDASSVHTSVAKMLLLKTCFVAQAVLLSALSTDLVFQLCKDPKTAPVVPRLWITPVTMVAGVVMTLTRSYMVMTHHLVQSLSIAVIPSLVLLNAKFSPLDNQSLETNMLIIYAVSLVAVFWQDVKDFILEWNIIFPFRLFGATALKDSLDNNHAPIFTLPKINQAELATAPAIERRARDKNSRSKSPGGTEGTQTPAARIKPNSSKGRQDRPKARRNRSPGSDN